MNILVITNTTPYPTISGGRLRVYNLLKRVGKHHRVWLASHLHEPNEYVENEVLDEFCQAVITGPLIRKSPISHLPGIVQYVQRGIPPELKFLYSTELAQKIRELLQKVPFDVIQIEESSLAPYLELIPPNSSVKRIVTLYDINFAQMKRIASIETRRTKKIRMIMHSAMMRYWEPKYLEHFDRCITVSEIDQNTLKSMNPCLPIDVVPNGVDTKTCQLLPPVYSPTVMFVGSMNYPPCVDAMLYFVNKIVPLIRRTIPELKVTIVGANPKPEIQALQSDTVTVTGRVPEVQPYYEQNKVVVVPLRAGGGTRLKILEAMAFGRAVVSTAIGAEGLNIEHNQQLLLADTTETFAEQVINLLRDNALYSRITAEARKHVMEHYDWDVIATQMMNIYEDVVQ